MESATNVDIVLDMCMYASIDLTISVVHAMFRVIELCKHTFVIDATPKAVVAFALIDY